MLGTFESARNRMLNEDTSEFSVLDLCTVPDILLTR